MQDKIIQSLWKAIVLKQSVLHQKSNNSLKENTSIHHLVYASDTQARALPGSRAHWLERGWPHAEKYAQS